MIISGSAGEILGWGIVAAALSGMIGLLFSAIMLALELTMRNRSSEGIPWFRTGLVVAGAIAWLAALLVYFTAGQPGFYGEELFVLLDSQADLSPARQIADPVDRRQFVYDSLVEHAGTTQADLRDQLERFNLAYTPYYLVNGIRVRGGPLVRLWLSNQPGIAEVLDVPVLRPLPKMPPTASGNASIRDKPLWNLTLIHADRVWQLQQVSRVATSCCGRLSAASESSRFGEDSLSRRASDGDRGVVRASMSSSRAGTTPRSPSTHRR